MKAQIGKSYEIESDVKGVVMNGVRENQKSESVQNASQHTGIGQKMCFKCGKEKLLTEFYKYKNMADGRLNKCRTCANNDSRKWQKANPEKAKEINRRSGEKWRQANPEKAKERNKEWSKTNLEKKKKHAEKWKLANPEKVKEIYKKWQKANPEKVKEKNQKWRAANPEKAKEATNKWQKANPEKHAVKQRNRRAMKKNAEGSHTEKDIKKLFEQQGGICNACGKKLIRYNKKQYHTDHIISLAKGGSNGPNNLQLLCSACNFSKSAKDPIQWAREHGRLF